MKEYYLGCDASKGYGDFVIINAKKETMVENFQLDDTFTGHNYLYQQVESFLKEHPDARLSTGIESTGGYENNWYAAFTRLKASLNIRVAHINPVRKPMTVKQGSNATRQIKSAPEILLNI